MDKRYDELEARVRALEVTVGVLERLLGASLAGGDGVARSSAVEAFQPRLLSTLTTKQHVALQMLMAGKSNAEIAERFGVTENGAKVYVRAIFKKFGVHTRSQAVVAAFEEWERVESDRYAQLSRGVPKSWAADWLGKSVEQDPYASKYRVNDDGE